MNFFFCFETLLNLYFFVEPQPEKPIEEKSAQEVEQNPVETQIDESQTQKEKIDSTSTKEQRPDSPHDESDFEDNITVTVPPAHLQSGEAFRDRHLNGRHGRPSHPSEMDTPPKTGHPQLVKFDILVSKIICFSKNLF